MISKRSVFLPFFLTLSLYSIAQSSDMLSKNHVTDAKGDIALLVVPALKEARLLQLRGLTGTGKIFMQVDQDCFSMNTRLVAGGFSGMEENLNDEKTVRLKIEAQHVVYALSKGWDIVSEDVSLKTKTDPHDADVTILSGLGKETGFVINPGNSFLADIFEASRSDMACAQFNKILRGDRLPNTL